MNISKEPETCLIKCSKPIPIPQTSLKPEYSLKQNFLNPDKLSPPNSWNTRFT